jgi:hypothetical protein
MKKKTLVHAGLLVCCLLIDLFVGAQTNTKGKVLVCGCNLNNQWRCLYVDPDKVTAWLAAHHCNYQMAAQAPPADSVVVKNNSKWVSVSAIATVSNWRIEDRLMVKPTTDGLLSLSSCLKPCNYSCTEMLQKNLVHTGQIKSIR